MALKFLSAHTGSGGTSSSVKLFDIRLDNEYIVFRGSEEEAGSAQLAGQLVLALTEPLTTTGITLTLSGILHMSYSTTSSSSLSGRRNASKEKPFFQKTWTFRDPGKGRTETLPSNNYSWPFDLVLDGTLPESVEGLKEAYIVYRFKAEIGRKRAKDIVVRKPLRIVRTLASSALELSHAMSVENVWPNKIEYSISTPSKAVIFGSFLQVDFKLIPLLKGLVIGSVSTQLKEEHEFMMDPEWGVQALNGGIMKDDRIIAFDNYTLNTENDLQIIEEAAEGFQFSRYLELPKSLTKCMQDCNVKGLKIRHKIKFNVQLHNPDGHVSELRANLPVALYISESLPLNENNDLVDQTPQAGRAAVENDMHHSAPPLYGEHQFDQLYGDQQFEAVYSGYRTPGAALSNGGTPSSLSRNISSENLASLAGVADGHVDSTHVSASALQHRLLDLRRSDRVVPSIARDDYDQPAHGSLSRRGSIPHANGDYHHGIDEADGSGHHSRGTVSGRNSVPESNTVSRRTSNENHTDTSGTATPFFQTDHFEDLAKVPSYSTAIRTPIPRSNNSGVDLPSYGSCVAESRPVTPIAPPMAHLRDPNGQTFNSSYQPSEPQTMSRNHSDRQNDERRLRLMQLRHRT